MRQDDIPPRHAIHQARSDLDGRLKHQTMQSEPGVISTGPGAPSTGLTADTEPGVISTGPGVPSTGLTEELVHEEDDHASKPPRHARHQPRSDLYGTRSDLNGISHTMNQNLTKHES